MMCWQAAQHHFIYAGSDWSFWGIHQLIVDTHEQLPLYVPQCLIIAHFNRGLRCQLPPGQQSILTVFVVMSIVVIERWHWLYEFYKLDIWAPRCMHAFINCMCAVFQPLLHCALVCLMLSSVRPFYTHPLQLPGLDSSPPLSWQRTQQI